MVHTYQVWLGEVLQSGVFDMCPQSSDAVIYAAAACCPALRFINVVGVKGISTQVSSVSAVNDGGLKCFSFAGLERFDEHTEPNSGGKAAAAGRIGEG